MARSVSGTLTQDQVETVTVTGVADAGIEIVNLSQTGVIWYRLDGLDPAVGGDGSHPVLGARRVDNPWTKGAGTVTVKLIADAALDYCVEAEPKWERA